MRPSAQSLEPSVKPWPAKTEKLAICIVNRAYGRLGIKSLIQIAGSTIKGADKALKYVHVDLNLPVTQVLILRVFTFAGYSRMPLAYFPKEIAHHKER